MNIRKDSKVIAHTGNNVAIIGTVTSVHGENITVETPAGETHDVLKTTATKVSAAKFKTLVLEASQPKVEVTTPVVAKVNKKADARKIFNKLNGKKRKEVITAFMGTVGLSAAGSSTYYQNFKSGVWSTTEATK